MNRKTASFRTVSLVYVLVALSLVLVSALAGCAPAPAVPAASTAAPAEPTAAPAAPTAAPAAKVVNRAGVELPADAAPIEKQVLRLAADDGKWIGWDSTVYDSVTSSTFGLSDSCVRPDRNFDPQPNACESWEVSEDGLTWTFHLQKDKVWSDGEPVTADDWVFTLQRYARPDYDFEWFYGMAGIENWDDVVSGAKPPEELGAKKVDDYTFTVKTSRPTPYLVRIFSDLWVVPQHIIKDRLADGSWASDPKTAVSTAPYKLEKWEKGKEIVWVANDKYTGPFPPMSDKIVVSMIPAEARFNAYRNGEVDMIGFLYDSDMTPAAMAQVMNDPKLKEQLITWPNFITFYNFFDTWNPPFDNLKVRQAFSHAIDRDAIVNGPLQYQATPAYSMNPPGFPGENVEGLKGVQNYDPKLAAQLMEEAGYPGGKGFPELTLYTRNASPALTNAAEMVVAMLKENLGVKATVQNLDYTIFSEKMRNQKKNKDGDFKFALVSYEFDFVDGSNMLSVWGGCEKPGADKSEQPGRHTWYNQEFNKLLCEAGALIGDEAKRAEMYRQAEKLLVEDVALVPLYHGIYNAMVQPYMKGPALEPGPDGKKTLWRYRIGSSEGKVYHANQ
jgi:ABC-type transport system substrate-binding protein